MMLAPSLFFLFLFQNPVHSFVVPTNERSCPLYQSSSSSLVSFFFPKFVFRERSSHCFLAQRQNEDDFLSRRDIIIGLSGVSAITSLPWIAMAETSDSDVFIPAKRPLAYRVDSTIPPTLLPLTPQEEVTILSRLGRGSGTTKAGVVADRITLNNMMNKGVFGTISALQSAVRVNESDLKKSGPGYASFVALGVPNDTSEDDITLAQKLIDLIWRGRKSISHATGLGLAFVPWSAQGQLESYLATGDFNTLNLALTSKGVPEKTLELYKPILELSRANKFDLIAMSPEPEDLRIVRTEGLQNVNSDRRAEYVLDSEGFIALTQDPKFRLYSERSLLKDFQPILPSDQPGNFFAERILVHEAGATALVKYAAARPESLVLILAPVADVRFQGGYTGRLERISRRLLGVDESKISDECITTILLNPTAKETLSLSRHLRLEIGTSPSNIQYQTKISDYLWFSKIPKVNLIPRLMNF
jgi:Haem-binding uptake, Tiki superfamily, ChaN